MVPPMWFQYLVYGLAVCLSKIDKEAWRINQEHVLGELRSIAHRMVSNCRRNAMDLHSRETLLPGEKGHNLGSFEVGEYHTVKTELVRTPCKIIRHNHNFTLPNFSHEYVWEIRTMGSLYINFTILSFEHSYPESCYDAVLHVVTENSIMGSRLFCGKDSTYRSMFLPNSRVRIRFLSKVIELSPSLLAFMQVYDPVTTNAVEYELGTFPSPIQGLLSAWTYHVRFRDLLHLVYHIPADLSRNIELSLILECSKNYTPPYHIAGEIYDGPYNYMSHINGRLRSKFAKLSEFVICDAHNEMPLYEKYVKVRSSIGDLTLSVTIYHTYMGLQGNASYWPMEACPGLFCDYQDTRLLDSTQIPDLIRHHHIETTQIVCHHISKQPGWKQIRLKFLSITVSQDYIEDCSVNGIILFTYQPVGLFCTKALLHFLSSAHMQHEGIIFSQYVSVIIKGYSATGTISITYNISLSDCFGIINVCRLGPPNMSFQGYIYEDRYDHQLDLFVRFIDRRHGKCLKIYAIPSNSDGFAFNCTMRITRQNNIQFNRLNVTLRGPSQAGHCKTYVILQTIRFPNILSQAEVLVAGAEKHYMAKDVLVVTNRGCPWLDNLVVITVTNPVDDCPAAVEDYSHISILTVCGGIMIPTVYQEHHARAKQWTISLNTLTGEEDYMRSCCYMDIEVTFPRNYNLDSVSVEAIDFFKDNSSIAGAKYINQYKFYPTSNFTFTFSHEFITHNGFIIIREDLTHVGCYIPSNATEWSPNYSLNVTYHRRFVSKLFSKLFVGPGFSLCSQSPIPYSWWHSCDVHCYLFYRPNAPISWTEASQYCEERGGHLITPHTDAEWKRLLKWAQTGTQNGVIFEDAKADIQRATLFNERLLFLGLTRNARVSLFLCLYLLFDEPLEQPLVRKPIGIRGPI